MLVDSGKSRQKMIESEPGRSLKRRKTDSRKRIRNDLRTVFMFSFVIFFSFEERVGGTKILLLHSHEICLLIIYCTNMCLS